MSVLIKGGRIITAADDYVGDIYVEGERISLIGESLDLQAERVIDAAGKYVLPGCVDPHTHLDMPFGGTTTIDNVESGQTAAAFGGTTCHVDFIIQPPGSTFGDAIDDWRGKANGKQVIDMGYHMAVTDLREGGTLEELASLPEQGITSYKLWHARGRLGRGRRDLRPGEANDAERGDAALEVGLQPLRGHRGRRRRRDGASPRERARRGWRARREAGNRPVREAREVRRRAPLSGRGAAAAA